MTTDMSILSLVMGASFPVQIVLFILLAASFASWSIIFTKRRLIRRTKSASDDFETSFWFNRVTQQGGVEPDKIVEECRRAMRVSQMREVDRLEESLATLATIGSTSPYVGLFGTVWGIMNSFRALGNVQSATLAMVAPGIAEALVATAMGLFAAIPAVIAYNRYADKAARLEIRYDGFMEEFSSILQRHSRSKSKVG